MQAAFERLSTYYLREPTYVASPNSISPVISLSIDRERRLNQPLLVGPGTLQDKWLLSCLIKQVSMVVDP